MAHVSAGLETPPNTDARFGSTSLAGVSRTGKYLGGSGLILFLPLSDSADALWGLQWVGTIYFRNYFQMFRQTIEQSRTGRAPLVMCGTTRCDPAHRS
jgi:hypothetical protein